MSAQKLIELMLDLQFEPSTATLYALILRQSPITELRLIDASGLGRAQTPEALGRLIQLRLIASDTNKEGQVFYAVDPKLAWLSMTADLVWSIDSSLKPLDSLPETQDTEVEHLRILCSEVKTLASDLYHPYSIASLHRYREAENPEELARLLCEIISQAQKEILAVSKSPLLPQVALFWTVLTNRMNCGVIYHRIIDLNEIAAHGLRTVERDIAIPNLRLQVIEHGEIKHKFYVIDRNFIGIQYLGNYILDTTIKMLILVA